ncbi:TrpB-like pyridoxal phosphate-dependent enzyme [Streptomyces xanthophaeus]|uniref:TrpB-like pyridoxal phosphate-dependent enzyme n=1 Tax=Streptomyces xanthophaeus TaxID=67385 RepID=UPI0039902C2F
MTSIPTTWYNIIPDLPEPIAPDLPAPGGRPGLNPQIPTGLVRQELSKASDIAIPAEVLEHYRAFRPTPLRRAEKLERELGVSARIYYKYEGGNVSGSHKLNSALAQAFYYKQAGAKRLVTATGAGQWGTALAAACRAFGLECHVYMVGNSYQAKPYRRVVMEMLGATVVPSPTPGTDAGREALAENPGTGGSLAIAMAEALEDARRDSGSRFATGSGESYSLLHQTVIGLEAQEQMAAYGEQPDVVIASLGAGSNFGGLAGPFLRDKLRGGEGPRCIAVEPTACPKLTRGVYRYDFTDSSRATPLQKMYTLGHAFSPAAIHAGGLRYHGTAKIVSSLYSTGTIESVAYGQNEVLASGLEFARAEGIIPAPESSHAVHAAIVEARKATAEGAEPVILLCLSGHGQFDLAAYDAHLQGTLDDSGLSTEELAVSLSSLPEQPETPAHVH